MSKNSSRSERSKFHPTRSGRVMPPWLKPGDQVCIISPSGRIDKPVVERGAELLRQQGYKVRIGRHAFDGEGVFAGSDRDRARDMQKALDEPSIKAVFFSRGGYGCLRTHMRLDWSRFLEHPKWLVGFSDITVFHAYLSRRKISSVHGVMTASFERDGALTEGFSQMMDLLRGNVPDQLLPPHPLNRAGSATGILTGGNLSIIQSLRGTPLDIKPKGKILFIEDLNELHYHLDRMLRNLEAGGILSQLSGLIVGHFTGMRDGATPYGRSAFEIISESVAPYDYPVVFGFPAGHELPNQPLLMGGRVALDVSAAGAAIRNVIR
jgi:muramoyltetrapeptide carboxypeptidase